MKPEHIEDVLIHLHSGQWFGWSDSKNKVYANLVIYGDQEKPTEDWLNAELKRQQDAYDNDYSRKRREAYNAAIPIGDQLDAILKWANLMRMDGTNLPEDLDQIVSAWLTVKQKFPKS